MFILYSLVALLGLFVKNSSSLTGANICQTPSGPACCYNTYEVDGRCVDCQPGYYGQNCKTRCIAGFFGQKCRSKCNCDKEYCDAIVGCKTTIASTTTTTLTPSTTKQTTILPTTITTLAQIQPRVSIPLSTPGIITEESTPEFTEFYFSTESATRTADEVKNGSAPDVLRNLGNEAFQQKSSVLQSRDINLSTIIAIVSSAVAILLIIAIVILLINNKVKKAKKRQERGRRNERAAISVMSKVYDEINDSLVRPSCSNDMNGAPSNDTDNTKYETIAKMRGKSNDNKGSRGSYELLDEVTKISNANEMNRGSYELLDSVASKAKDYESLETDAKKKEIKKGGNSKGSNKLKSDSDKKPVYAQVLKNTLERKASETKQDVPDSFAKPPSLPVRKDTSMKVKTVDENDSSVNYMVCEEDTPMLVLEVDASAKRQLANSIVNDSYEIPLLRKCQTTGNDSGKCGNDTVKEGQEGDCTARVDGPMATSKTINDVMCNIETEGGNENYDIPPPKVYKSSEKERLNEFCENTIDQSSHVCPRAKAKNIPISDECDTKSEIDYDAPPTRIAKDQNILVDYDVPPNKTLCTTPSLGNGTISRGRGELCDKASDYDTPLSASRNENYDVPPLKRI